MLLLAIASALARTPPAYEYAGVKAQLAAHCEMPEPRSDKTAQYSMMYGLFLWPLRELSSGKLLEIGLGCDQGSGPGASARSWRKWLPNLELWEAEYDAACVENNRGKMDKFGINALVGDQSNRTDLRRWLVESGGAFSAVIDDGSHRNADIMASFEELWPHVLPGGVYFIEDMITGRPARWDNTRGDRVVSDILQAWSDQLMVGPFAGMRQHPSKANQYAAEMRAKFPKPKDVAFVFCQYSACALGKAGSAARADRPDIQTRRLCRPDKSAAHVPHDMWRARKGAGIRAE